MKKSKVLKITTLEEKITTLEEKITKISKLYTDEVANHDNTKLLLNSKNKIIRDFKGAINEFVKS